MPDTIQLPGVILSQLNALVALCRQHHVQSMALFGSVLEDRFDPACSDLDFAVQFEVMPPAAHAEHFFGLLNALRELFGRPIDLLETSSLRNPYLRARIQAQQVVIYGG